MTWGDDLTERLLQPLAGDDAERPVLRHELGSRLRQAPGGQVAAALEEMGAAGDAAPRWCRPRVLVPISLLLVLCAVALQLREMLPALAETRWAPDWLQREGARQIYDLPPEQVPVLTVREDDRPRLERARAASQAHPDDPVLYWAYISWLYTCGEHLPANYEATWRRIDPDNGIWQMLAAEDALLPDGWGMPTEGESKALERMSQAARAPRLHDYRLEWVRLMRHHTRPATTYLRQSQRRNRIATLLGESPPFPGRLYEMVLNLPSSRPERQQGSDLFERLSHANGMPGPEDVGADEPAPDAAGRKIFHARLALSTASLLLVALAAAASLRALPRRGQPGKLARCLARLERPADLPRLIAASCGPALAIAGGCYLVAWNPETLPSLTIVVAVLAPLVVALTMTAVAGRQVTRRTGFLGFGSSARREVFSGGMALASVGLFLAMLVMIVSDPGSSPQLPVGFCITGLGLAALATAGRVLLGYATPSGNIRHRLIAGKVARGLALSAGVVALLALGLQAADRAMVAGTARSGPPATAAPATRPHGWTGGTGFSELIHRWYLVRNGS